MEQQKIKILHQSLKTKWYRMIENGEKLEEYRDATPYWCKRFIGHNFLPFSHLYAYSDLNTKGYTHVQFSLGYPKKDDTSRRMTFELKGIVYREGREEWGAEPGKKYFVEVLGRRTTLDGTKLWEDNPLKQVEDVYIKFVRK